MFQENEDKQMWLPPYIHSNSWGKRGGAMIEAVLLEVICLLFFGLIVVTIIAITLIIALVIILSNKKTHL